MFHWMGRLLRAKGGSVAPIFGLLFAPMLLTTGMATDYASAVMKKANLQAALDSAVLAAVTIPSGSARDAFAASTLAASLPASPLPSAMFVTNTDGSYTGKATLTVPTSLLQIAGIKSVSISATATAASHNNDNSCVLALGKTYSGTSTNTITFSGIPVLNLSGCGIRSNQSISCSGHDSNATVSQAVGALTGCSNPQKTSAAVDLYAPLASSISKKCTTTTQSVTWSVGKLPSGLLSYDMGSYREYHVCGNLTLSGSGSLVTGSTPTIIVIENGTLTLANNANVTANLAAFVFTGTNQSTTYHQIVFPNGNGKSATLTVEPPITTAWHGVAIYYDPSLTYNVDMDLGPGGSLLFDGVAYMPYSNVTFHGDMESGTNKCSKLVINTFTISGSSNLALAESATACAAITMTMDTVPVLSQ